MTPRNHVSVLVWALAASLHGAGWANTTAPTTAPAAKAKAKAKAAPAVPVADAVLTPAQLAIADRVHVGQMPCEMGQHITLSADAHAPGHFHLQLHKQKFRMAPVETTTGAIRLEDTHSGAVWLQLANKSMLMNQKLGKRMADECMSPAQVAVAQALKQNPAPSVLDSPTKP